MGRGVSVRLRSTILSKVYDHLHNRGNICSVIEVGTSNQYSLPRRRPIGRSGWITRFRTLDILNSTSAVVMFFVATIAAGTSLAFTGTGDADPENDLRWNPVAILSSPNHASVSWQVRSPGQVRIRLYRAVPGGVESLVGEFTTEAGVSAFEMVDDVRPPGATIYQVRAVGIGGGERVLGSILCVESGFSTGVVAFGWDSSHHPANSTSVSEVLLLTEELIQPEDRPVLRQPRRRPDPPVPRSEPSRC